MNAREAAFLAVYHALRGEQFIVHFLDQWQHHENPSPQDVHLAQEIAAGTVRMGLALDYLAEQLSNKGKISLKVKERALLRTAIYQFYYMDRVPPYAIVNESVALAKKHCNLYFVKFLNALLRKLTESKLALPTGTSLTELSVAYSYPPYFIQVLMDGYGLEKTREVLFAGNQRPVIMMRRRATFEMVPLDNRHEIQKIADSTDYYIQNSTPVTLIQEAVRSRISPANILDLCASPGGKLLLAHDLFPRARLFANDVSADKLKRLEQNGRKYGMEMQLSCGLGEQFESSTKFDLIILDVPCSNSGVLNKRPEARWRLNEASLKELNAVQLRLIAHAKTLLSAEGEIWYLTCSILQQENESLIAEACQNVGLKSVRQKTILPDLAGNDGGFLSVLRKRL